jgi:hypothetical protein
MEVEVNFVSRYYLPSSVGGGLCVSDLVLTNKQGTRGSPFSHGVQCIDLVNNQLDALFQCIYLFIYLFYFCTCFEQPSAHHQENHLYQYIIWYISLYVGDCLVCRSGGTGIPDSHLMMSTGLLETCAEVK